MKKIVSLCLSLIFMLTISIQASASTNPNNGDININSNNITIQSVQIGEGGGGPQSFIITHNPYVYNDGVYQHFDFYLTAQKAYDFKQQLGNSTSDKIYSTVAVLLFGKGALTEGIAFVKRETTTTVTTPEGHLVNLIFMLSGKVFELRATQFQNLKDRIDQFTPPSNTTGIHIHFMTVQGGLGVAYTVENWDGVTISPSLHDVQEFSVLSNSMTVPDMI